MSPSGNTQESRSAEARMKHDTPEYREIAEYNTILRCQVGSRLHGVVVGDQDDSDEMALVIEPPEYVIRPPERETGFKRFWQYEHRTADRGERSGPDDECLIAYSLRKWVGRAAHGDPTMLLPLFAPEHQISMITWPGHEARRLRKMFLSKQVGDRYLGYLDEQTACLKGESPTRTNRPELIAVHGYDTKYAFHALRLAYQGWEMMRTEQLLLPVRSPEFEVLSAVRNGQMSLAGVLGYINRVRDELIDAYDESLLPDFPDYDRIGQWLVRIYRTWWDDERRWPSCP